MGVTGNTPDIIMGTGIDTITCEKPTIMSQGQRPRSQRLNAKAAAEAAAKGELPRVNDYDAQQIKDNQFSITVPLLFMQNTPFDGSSKADAYIDFQRGVVVYDFKSGEGGDGDGGE